MLQEIRKLQPEDVIAMISLARIAREEGDIQEEERLLKEQLEIEPQNVIAITNLANIARKRGDDVTEKKLLKTKLEILQDNMIEINSITIEKPKREVDEKNAFLKMQEDFIITIRRLITLAKKEGNIEEAIKLLNMQLERDLDNAKAKRELDKLINIEKSKVKKTPIERARDLIYKSEDIILSTQEIKELIEGEKEEDTKFVLAELYAKAGTTERARKLLTGYKKSLDPNNTKREYIKLVNRAIELASSKVIKRFAWDRWWEQKREFGSIDGEDVSGNNNLRLRKDEGR